LHLNCTIRAFVGEQEDIGITLALIPTNTAGVSIGRRHFPLDSAFQNGPNWGKDVLIRSTGLSAARHKPVMAGRC